MKTSPKSIKPSIFDKEIKIDLVDILIVITGYFWFSNVFHKSRLFKI